MVRSIVWMSEPLARALRPHLPPLSAVVTSARELVATKRDTKTVLFVDGSTIAEVHALPMTGPIVAICDEPLQTPVAWLTTYPWLSHVISAAMLDHSLAKEHITNVMMTVTKEGQARLLDWVGPEVAGRRIRLTHASKRAERLERMGEFLESKGVGTRTVALLRDAAEELLTNAFYDAPVAAGAVSGPISRTQDVSLPEDSACDMVYGCRDDLAIVRVRDPFGSLSRMRLIEVLTRCARSDMQVEVDETMGGAGLGLWRIFTAASYVAISVVNGRATEFLVGIGKRSNAGPRPFAFHLFFKEPGRPVRRWKLLDHDSSKPFVDNSISIVMK